MYQCVRYTAWIKAYTSKLALGGFQRSGTAVSPHKNIHNLLWIKIEEREMSSNRRADDNYYLYHFTDAKNLDSIRKYGLLSWITLGKNNLYYEPVADDLSHELDLKKGWENYVRLSFCKYHPMGQTKANKKNSEIVILKISPKILIDRVDTKKSVIITNTNATTTNPNFRYYLLVPYLSEIEKLPTDNNYCGPYRLPSPLSPEHEVINGLFNFKDEKNYFDIPTSRTIKKPDYSEDINSSFKKQQAEVLIKEPVPVEYIVNLADPELFPPEERGTKFVENPVCHAKRPIFIANDKNMPIGITQLDVDFDWHKGMSLAVRQRSIKSLHEKAALLGYDRVLEASSKTYQDLGINLSAFYLKNSLGIPVENIFQGSKVFTDGGPFTDLFNKDIDPRDAKRDKRLKSSGYMVKFMFNHKDYPLEPKSLFYDWLYINILIAKHNRTLLNQLVDSDFNAFSDIEFNPKKSFSCQARTLALFVSLYKHNAIEQFCSDPVSYSAKMNLYSEVHYGHVGGFQTSLF